MPCWKDATAQRVRAGASPEDTRWPSIVRRPCFPSIVVSLIAVTVRASLTNSAFHIPPTSPRIGNGTDGFLKFRVVGSPT